MDDTARQPAAPRTESRPATSDHFGITLTDDFAWLRAENWQEVMRDPGALDPAILAYLQQENAYCQRMLADTEPLQAKLFSEMKGRIKQDNSTVPSVDGDFAYYIRYREGGQHPLICRRPRDGGAEAVLLDGDALAEGKSYFHFGATRHSPDHRLLAWSADDSGSELYTARVRELATGTDLSDIVPDVYGSVVWSSDTSSFFYVRLDDHHRPFAVYRHRLGTPVSDDVLVLEDSNPAVFVSLSETQSYRFAEVSIHDHETSESWMIDLTRPGAEPFLVAPSETQVQYDVEHHPALFGEDALIIRTNADGAEDFKIVWAPLATPGRTAWQDLVPHRQGVFIVAYVVFEKWLIRLEREDGLPRIIVRQTESGDEHIIAFAEEAYSLGVDPGYEFATDNLRLTYSSMTTPAEVWDYDLNTRHRDLRKRQEIPSGHNPADYVTRRIQALAPDGESIPISLLHRKGQPIDGTAPCLIYGYGAYGLSSPPSFSISRLSLVDRGFVFAIAHVRGGTEKGWRWYRNGKLGHKVNTFTDFIAATEYLIDNKWCARDRIVADGGSAGGTLMGAIANMRPDLYAGIIAEVPFVDVLNTMLDDTLPLTPPEWPEWGNPITDPEAFRTILSYSPYENVRAQDYPAMLVFAGLTDPRVTYWEPAKWVARLRATKTDENILLFRTNLDAGHGGAAGRFDRLEEIALAYAFAIKVTGGSLTA